MPRLGRLLIVFVLLAAAGAVVYVTAGRGAAPSLTIDRPERLVGQTGDLEVTAGAPDARFTSLTIALEQNGRSIPLFSLESPDAASVSQVDDDRIRISRPIGKRQLPDLQPGAARIVVSATRPSFLNLRTLSASASKDLQVRLDPPQIAVVSTHH
jgi:hypothetical protein